MAEPRVVSVGNLVYGVVDDREPIAPPILPGRLPDALFSRLGEMNVGVERQRVVDLGTGTGALARGFAHRACVVTGLDPAPAMLEQARRLDVQAGVQVSYRVGRAEDTALQRAGWDVVCAGRCWHWFDRPRAADEARRLLVAGGALVICHMDYLPLAGNVCTATEALILEHNPSWTIPVADHFRSCQRTLAQPRVP